MTCAVDVAAPVQPVLAQPAHDVLDVDDGVVDHHADARSPARPGSSC